MKFIPAFRLTVLSLLSFLPSRGTGSTFGVNVRTSHARGTLEDAEKPWAGVADDKGRMEGPNLVPPFLFL